MSNLSTKNSTAIGTIHLFSNGAKKKEKDIQFPITTRGIKDVAQKINDIFNNNTAMRLTNILTMDHLTQPLYCALDQGRQDIRDMLEQKLTSTYKVTRASSHFRQPKSAVQSNNIAAPDPKTLLNELNAQVAAQDQDPTYAQVFAKDKAAQKEYDDNIASQEGFVIVPRDAVISQKNQLSLTFDEQAQLVTQLIPTKTKKN